MEWWWKVVTNIGSVVGFATGLFVLFDRWFRDRPIVDIRAKGGRSELLEVVIVNGSKRSIVIRGIECGPNAWSVGYSDDLDGIAGAVTGARVKAMLAPEEKHEFVVIFRDEWEQLSSHEKASIVVQWTFTNATWLSQWPIRLKFTVGDINELRKLRRKPHLASTI